MIEGTSDAVYVKDPAGCYLLFNTAAARFTGKRVEEVIGKDDTSIFPIDEAKAVMERDHAVIAGGKATTYEEHVTDAAGKRLTFLETKGPLFDAHGKLIGPFGISRDITDLKRAEEVLAYEQKFSQSLLENLDAGVVACDAEGKLVLFNRVAREWHGLDPLKISQEEWARYYDLYLEDGVTPMDINTVPLARAYRGETIRDIGMVIAAKGRPKRQIIANCAPILDEDGRISGAVGVMHDITERNQAEAALRASEERFSLAMEASRDGLWDWNISTGEVYYSPGYNAMLGYSSGELPAHFNSWLNLIHPEDKDAALEANMGCVENRRDAFVVEFRMQSKDGEWRWILGRGKAIRRDKNGRAPRLVGTHTDITERKQAAEALQKANEQLAEANRRKDEFLAMLAHELRNPLAPVRNAVQVLRIVGPCDPVLMRQRNIIDRQVTHMARLVDNLLDVSRITRGRIELKRQTLFLADVLANAIELVSPLIETRRQKISLALPPDELCVEGDPDRLAQVVGNLLSNAAKFTEEEGQIWLETAREGGAAVIRVRDTGAGIALEMLPRVFDLFAQADQGLARSQGGLGIGLTMVKLLVEMHGGTVEARSGGLGQGSEFTIRLPALPSEVRVPNRSERREERAPEARPRRILVVDDVVDFAESLAEMLRLLGHEVRTAYDGSAALKNMCDYLPDMVLLDIGMPGMDGYEVARRLRQQECGRKTLLVAVTGYAQDRDRQISCEAGFDAHLTKPVDLDILRKLLSQRASFCP